MCIFGAALCCACHAQTTVKWARTHGLKADVKTKEEFCAAGAERESEGTTEQEEAYCASPLLYWEDFIKAQTVTAQPVPTRAFKKVIVDSSLMNNHHVIVVSVTSEDAHTLVLSCNAGWAACTMPQAGQSGQLVKVRSTLYEGANVVVVWDDPDTQTGRYVVRESR